MNQLIAIVLQALIAVESGGDINALGDNGTAWGCLQIRQQCLDDVNSIQKRWKRSGKWQRPIKVYTKKDCFNRQSSIEIATIYLTYWARVYENQTGQKVDARHLSLIWNAGPYRAKKIALTREYWRKTHKALAKIPEYLRHVRNVNA